MNRLESLMKIKDSLDEAVERCGGSNIAFSFEQLNRMSALDLLKSLGPNHVVFKFEPPPEEKEEKEIILKYFIEDFNKIFNNSRKHDA